jgi:hypothetical protein
VGRRPDPELKSDETCDANVIVIEFEITMHLCVETAKTSGAVIGGATLAWITIHHAN